MLADFRHILYLYESNSDKFLDVQNSNVTTIWFIPGISFYSKQFFICGRIDFYEMKMSFCAERSLRVL